MFETYRGIVHRHQLDHMGHMNVMWYTSKFDEATWHLMAQIGMTNRYMQENMCGMVALDQRTQYKSELMEGDLIVIKSAILELGRKTISFRHDMHECESGKLAAVTHFVGVHLDRQARKSMLLPELVTEKANQFILDYPAAVLDD